MPTVAIIYHSGFGHTKLLAESVHAGVGSVADTTAHLISVEELPPPGADRTLAGGRWADVHGADALIFGCPTYMGSVSAGFKGFMESSSVVWLTQGWRDKLAAGFTIGGGLAGDKLNALTDMAVFAGQQSMIWVSCGVPMGGEEGLNRLGSYLGMQAQAGEGPPEDTVIPEDRKTAEKFGARVAEATARWVAGKNG